MNAGKFARTMVVALVAVGVLTASTASAAREGRGARAGKTALQPGEKIDLNSASEADLMRLPGIGPKRAAAILSLRSKRPFRRVWEIRRVRGIGKKSFKRLLPFITVGKPQKAAKNDDD